MKLTNCLSEELVSKMINYNGIAPYMAQNSLVTSILYAWSTGLISDSFSLVLSMLCVESKSFEHLYFLLALHISRDQLNNQYVK